MRWKEPELDKKHGSASPTAVAGRPAPQGALAWDPEYLEYLRWLAEQN